MLFPPPWERFWKSAGALWFLVALFLVNLLYYSFQYFFNKRGVLFAIILCSVLGYVLMKNKVVLPFEADISLVSLPYFLLGCIVREKGFMRPSKYDKLGLFVIIPCAVLIYLFSEDINFLYQIVPNYFKLYLIPYIAILSLFWFCNNIPYIPLICFYGRYSIIVLGTHQLLISYIFFAVKLFLSIHGSALYWTFFIIVMFIELFIIKFMIKYFPRVTAQEEFFKSGWKI